MKSRVVLTLILGLISFPSVAGWVAIATDEVATEYVNFETIQRSGIFAKMWNMSDFNAPQEVGNGRLFKSSKALQEYDCAHEKKRLISLIHYVQNMGQGQVAYLDSSSEDWRAVVSGSLGEVHLKAACTIREKSQ
jgi:hypothetical protein